MYSLSCQLPKKIDHRTRRDRVVRREQAFDHQLDALTEAYMTWSFACSGDIRTGFSVGNLGVNSNAGVKHQ